MSEREDNPPTLASLRARRGKIRTGRRPTILKTSSPGSLFQAGLFAVSEEDIGSSVAASVEDVIRDEVSETAAGPVPRKDTGRHDLMTERRIWSVRALVINVRQQIETTYTDMSTSH
jgi:exodeoxyribonuclease VII large subunit